jgi:hypothetical protein
MTENSTAFALLQVQRKMRFPGYVHIAIAAACWGFFLDRTIDRWPEIRAKMGITYRQIVPGAEERYERRQRDKAQWKEIEERARAWLEQDAQEKEKKTFRRSLLDMTREINRDVGKKHNDRSCLGPLTREQTHLGSADVQRCNRITP